jgi:hypothetical protein
VVEAVVRVRDPDVLGLRAVDEVAEDPATVHAVRVHALLARVALPARGDARDEDAIALREARDGGADLLDDADPLVPEDPAVGHRRHVALHDVEVGAADRGLLDPDDRVGGVAHDRVRLLLPGALPGAVVDERLHVGSFLQA